LHHGWVGNASTPLNPAEWGEVLAQQLETMRDMCRKTALKAGLERKIRYDSKHAVRSFLPDDF